MFGSLGIGEVLVILVIALIIFGPRKLPSMAQTLGKTLGQFRKASEDFKRSWEQEVTMEEKRLSASTPPPAPPPSVKEELVSGTPGGEAAATASCPPPSVKEAPSHEDHARPDKP